MAEEFDTISVDQLDTIALNLEQYLSVANVYGKLFKSRIGDVVAYIAPFLPAVGSTGLVFPDSSNVLPTPVPGTIKGSIVGSGTFTWPGGSLTTSGLLNIIATNGSVWSLVKAIDTSAFLSKVDYNFGGTYPSVAAANAAITNAIGSNGKNNRDGKRVDIGTAGNYVPYWWKGGFLDTNLVEYLGSLNAGTNALTSDDITAYVLTSGSVFTIMKNGTFTQNGTLQTVNLKCSTAGSIFISVFRNISGNNYKLVAKIPYTATVGMNVIDVLTVAPNTIVRSGDKLGFICVSGGAQVNRKIKTGGSNISRTVSWVVNDTIDLTEVNDYDYAITGIVRYLGLRDVTDKNSNAIEDLTAISAKQTDVTALFNEVGSANYNVGTTDALTTYTSTASSSFTVLQNVGASTDNGFFQSVSIRASTAGDIYFCLWRLVSGTDYKLISRILLNLPIVGVNTIDFSTLFPNTEIKTGDKLGYMNIDLGAKVYRKVKAAACNINRTLTWVQGDTVSFAEVHGYEFAINAIAKTKTLKERTKVLEQIIATPTPSASIPDYETAYQLMTAGVDKGFVGSSLWRKRKAGLTDVFSEVNKHEYYHADHKKVNYKLQNVKVVDTKGTGDVNNPGRILTHITKEGLMYFKNNSNEFKTIKVEDFLANLVQHDGSGTDYTRLDWTDMVDNATNADKLTRFNKEILNWQMLNEGTAVFQNVPKSASQGVAQVSLEFANGNIVNNNIVYRKDGTYSTIKLKNPVVGNPTHLIIKNPDNSVVQEIPLEQYGTSLRWGKMLPNVGTITYATAVGAAINFNNGKTITVPVNIASGTYIFTLRGRRYGSYLVDGTVDLISGSTTLGSIVMDGETATQYTYESSAVLVDRSVTLTVGATTSITLKANCATEKDFTPNNPSQGTSRNRWGWTAKGNYGTVTEYEAIKKRAGMMYYTEDNGEHYESLFDVSLSGTAQIDSAMTSINIGGGHVHGACIDLYWNKIWVVCGDSDHTKGIYHADLIGGTINSDTVKWVREPFMKPFYGSANGEQFCSVYAAEKAVIFGTDCIPSGLFRMNRINSEVLTDREPSRIIDVSQLSHIPTMYFQKDETAPIFIITMLADDLPTTKLDRVPMIHGTYDGAFIKEVWRDNLVQSGFGFNNAVNVFEYKGKIFASIFSDKRFAFSHSLIVGDITL